MYNVLLVDDEQAGLKNLQRNLELHCPQITEFSTALSALEGEKAMFDEQFDLLFLDINMPKVDGFDLLTRMKGLDRLPSVILVSANASFGLKAFEMGVVDYVTKPISPVDLKRAVSKAVEQIEMRKAMEQGNSIAEDNALLLSQRVGLPHRTGFELCALGEIVRMEADGSYTRVYKSNGKRLVVVKALKEFEELLPENVFLRVHHSHIINLHFLNGFTSENGGQAQMQNGDEILISRRKLPQFQKIVKTSNIFFGRK